MYCTNCGQQLEDTANFCSNCGYSQNAKPKPKAKPWVFFIVGLLIPTLVILFFTGNRDKAPDLSPKEATEETTEAVTEEPTQTAAQQIAVEEVCISCSGSGKCLACEGDGNCFFCDGTKLQDCYDCWQSEICLFCKGEGCDSCQNTGNCSYCDDGKRECGWCYDGGVCPYCQSPGNGICSTCDGTGKYNPEDHTGIICEANCDLCDNGIVKCDMCEGKNCYMCDGTGKGLCLFGPCSECDNGYLGSCDSCGGSGTCRYCFGKYTRDCSSCKDGVTIDILF